MPIIEKEQEANLYELAFLLPVNLELEALAQQLEKAKRVITEAGGVITAEPAPQKRRLGYPIKKQSQAYFGFFRFTILPAQLKSIEKIFRLEQQFIRFLTFRVTPQQIAEEERLAHHMRHETLRRPRTPTSTKPVAAIPSSEAPQHIQPEEFEQKMQEIEKAVE